MTSRRRRCSVNPAVTDALLERIERVFGKDLAAMAPMWKRGELPPMLALAQAEQAAESAAKRRRLAEADNAGPAYWQRQHRDEGWNSDAPDRTARMGGQIMDANGEIASPRRAYDTLLTLLKGSTISKAEYDAGRRFQDDFDLARLEPLGAMDVGRVRAPRNAGPGKPPAARIEEARSEVYAVMRVLGGIGSPAGSVVWGVLGEQLSIAAFADRTRFGPGRSLDRKTAQGMLVASLGVLVEHYRISTERAA